MNRHYKPKDFELKILKNIQRHGMLMSNQKVLVALSGGADSAWLFLVLIALQNVLSIDIEAVHVNHNLRQTALRDQKFVKELCEKYGVKLYIKNVNVNSFSNETSQGIEEAARNLRYKVFEETMEEAKADKLALAHHMDDQTETILFHMCRGCSIEGLHGILPVRDMYIRPLLGVSKAEIEDYLSKLNQEYVTDETNQDTTYSRNYLRNEIIPKLNEQICENSSEHIATIAEDTIQIEDYLSLEIDKEYKNCVIENIKRNEFSISISKIKDIHPFIQSMVIKKVLCNVCKTSKDIARVHVSDVQMLIDRQSGKTVNLPYQMTARREYDLIVVNKENDNDEMVDITWEKTIITGKEEIPYQKQIMLQDGRNINVRIFEKPEECTIPTKTYTKWFDYATIKDALVVRMPREEDYFMFDNQHKKLVKSYMKDQKIPASKRPFMPVVACENHVIYFIGGRISSACKVNENTKWILEIDIS